MFVERKFLVANPNIKNSIFAKSVIYIFEHNYQGASGFIINKKSEFGVFDVAMSCGYNFPDTTEPVYVGGPVARRNAFLLHSDEWYASSTQQVGSRLAITSDMTMFDKLCEGNTPAKWKLCIGMCSWAPEQLEWELEGLGRPHPSWVTCDADSSLIYSEDENDKIWEQFLDVAGQQWVDEFF